MSGGDFIDCSDLARTSIHVAIFLITFWKYWSHKVRPWLISNHGKPTQNSRIQRHHITVIWTMDILYRLFGCKFSLCMQGCFHNTRQPEKDDLVTSTSTRHFSDVIYLEYSSDASTSWPHESKFVACLKRRFQSSVIFPTSDMLTATKSVCRGPITTPYGQSNKLGWFLVIRKLTTWRRWRPDESLYWISFYGASPVDFVTS